MTLQQLVETWGSDYFVLGDEVRLFDNHGNEFSEIRNDWVCEAPPLRKDNPVILNGNTWGSWGDLLDKEIKNILLYKGQLIIGIAE